MDDASVRVSDVEREQAVLILREHLLAGRLTLEEFADRVGTAWSATENAELRHAHAGLPELFATGARSQRAPIRLIGALFGHVVRRGRLRLGKRAVTVSVLGDVDLDLRDVIIDHWQTTLIVVPALGNVDVYVPEGVNTILSGATLFGHSRDWGQDIDRADAPVVSIRVLGAGTIDVWRVPRDMHDASYDDIMRRLEARKELPG
jgi:hypothetical protein